MATVLMLMLCAGTQALTMTVTRYRPRVRNRCSLEERKALKEDRGSLYN